MSFQLYPAIAADIAAVAHVAGLCSTSDTHTHLKAIAKGYGFNSEGTARYHSEGMKPFFEMFLDDPKRDIIIAKSASGETIGSVVWARKGHNVDSKSDGEGHIKPEESLHDTTRTGPKFPMASSGLPPPLPPSPNLPRTVANLETVTNAAMKHYIGQLMPTDVVCRYIVSINVLPSCQNMGIGGALVKWGLDRARSEGVFCWVGSSMDGAPFFEKLGFVEVGRVEVDLDEWAEGIKKPIDNYGEPASIREEEQLWGKYIWNWMKWIP